MAMRLLLLLSTALAVNAQPAGIPTPDRDPFVGRWRANTEKSRPKLDKREATYERTIQREGDDIVFASRGGSSKASARSYRLRCDGRFHPLPTGPILSCRYVASDRIEGETRDPGGRLLYWAREVSSDGTQLTILEYRDKGRQKLRSTLVLNRVP